MAEAEYNVAIVGAGPAGLSAAGRAQFLDHESSVAKPSYVLLEGFELHAKTIQQYQKGKHVMAEPGFLALRSDFGFDAGSRESILDAWQASLETEGVNIQYGAEVTAVHKQDDVFELSRADGSQVTANNVILAMGTAGNPRRLGVDGEHLAQVQYQLDDPDEYSDEVIVVVGASDSAIENAIGLSSQNQVIIINRRDEFSRAKDGNLNAILAAINNPDVSVSCLYETNVQKIIENDEGEFPITIVFDTPEGEKPVPCHRVIARLGGIPPRGFVEAIGVDFPNKRPDAIPELTGTYESNVAGLYIVGALAGCPLIKQAMNQGYDVIEFIRGNMIKPADHPLLEYQFHVMPFLREVDELLSLFQQRIPMFRELNTLTFRELVIEANILVSYPEGAMLDEARVKLDALLVELQAMDPQPRTSQIIAEGDYLYRKGDYATSFFTIVEGEVIIESASGEVDRTLGRGEFFGEGSLISGQARIESAIVGTGCILVESPRRSMVKLMNSNEEVRAGIDWIFIVRELQRHFAPRASFAQLRDIAQTTPIHEFRAGEVIYNQGEQGASIHLVRRGSVTLSRETSDQPVMVAEYRSGELIGQLSLMGDPTRRETVVASVATETIEIERTQFLALIELNDAGVESLQAKVSAQTLALSQMEVRTESTDVMQFLMGQGLGEATNTLLIDERLCIGCDNCEKACAETHDGVSRLNRSEGASFAYIHVPISCRHCEHPHCMKDCPPNAINRGLDGEVFIDDSCIGCGNCEANCPYDVINMEYPAPEKPGLFQWMFLGRGSGPGQEPGYEPEPDAKAGGKRAMKCDACINKPTGPACVAACPTGAAQRLAPDQYIRLVG